MKKSIFIFAILSVSVSLLTGCGSSKSSSISSTIKTTEKSPNEMISENITATNADPSTEISTADEPASSRNEGEILSADDIVKRLNKISDIDEIVIEGSDSFSLLNFDDNYLSNVCFSLKAIDQSKFEGDNPIDRGTQCGGSVEVWATKESANERNDFLSSFDGGAGGSTHIVVDTMIIRVSVQLDQEEHDRIQQAVIDALN